MSVSAVVPIRSFDGLTRLESTLDGDERSLLMRTFADRTTSAATDAGGAVMVVTGDAEVRAWAVEHGFTVVDEPDPPGLNAAAASGIARAPSAWMVIHADLPAITPADVGLAMKWLAGAAHVLAPSYDGGTSLIGGPGGTFPFSYGVGSFRRHLAAAPDAEVLIRPGLALDLDRASDLAGLRTLAVI